jgi:hypothetical protein
MTQAYRYQIASAVPFSEVEESLLLAIIAGECLHGPSRARLEAAYCTDQKTRACVLDASTEVGRDIARIFTGLLTKAFGDRSFKLERVGAIDAETVPDMVASP